MEVVNVTAAEAEDEIGNRYEDVAVATGGDTYLSGPGSLEDEVYENCFVMRFYSAGRCREFPSGTWSGRPADEIRLAARVGVREAAV